MGEKGSIGIKSRDPQKAYLGLLLNVHTQFQLTTSNLEPYGCGVGEGGGEMGLKSRDPKKAHLRHLLNVHI